MGVTLHNSKTDDSDFFMHQVLNPTKEDDGNLKGIKSIIGKGYLVCDIKELNLDPFQEEMFDDPTDNA